MELNEAYALGKYDGIGAAETIMLTVISRAIEQRDQVSTIQLLRDVRDEFKAECARYRADINTPVTEEQKQELLKNTI